MAVIKNLQTERILKTAVVLDLGDLKNQGECLLNQARAEAKRIISEAQVESQRLISESAGKGHEEGLQLGIEEGRRQGAEEARGQILEEYAEVLPALQERWIEAMNRWESERSEMLLCAREEILTFALVLAKKVVHRAIEFDPEVVKDQLVAALSLITNPTSVRIVVSSQDRELLEFALPEVIKRIHTLEHIELLEDESLMRGGCRVITRGGEIDATIDTQFTRIVETLLPDSKRCDSGSTQDSEA